MTAAISVSNYEFQGQVLSPAFSDPPSPPPSPMSTSSDQDGSSSTDFSASHNFDEETTSRRTFVNGKPKYPTKYHELLLPLSPATSLPVATIVPTHCSKVNAELQEQFLNLLRVSTPADVERFLEMHSENVDVNRYNVSGQTPLHEACVEDNAELVRILVRFGADCRLTTRDGFSVLHLASFGGGSELFNLLVGLKRPQDQ